MESRKSSHARSRQQYSNASREQQPVAPGTITRVQATQRDPQRVSIFIDEQFAFTLSAVEVVQRGLRRGAVLDEPAVRALEELADTEKATAAALTFVAYRPRSEREVRDRLRQKKFSASAIDAAITQMRAWNYLDDVAFAEMWVENRTEHAPRGRRALAAELQSKGVDRETVAHVLDEADIDEVSAALQLARARMPRLAGFDEQTQKRRLSAYLGRRGYGWDTIRPVLHELFADDE